jgi:putative polyhydroxyalkanoic acid system protein
MAKIIVSVPYQIPQDQALSRIKAFVAGAKVKYADKVSGLQESWNGNVGTFSGSGSGFSVTGRVDVNPSVVGVELTVPFGAMLIKRRIESGISDELTRLLA